MSGSPRWGGVAARGPFAMALVIVAGLVGLVLLGPSSSPVQGAPPAPEVTAAFQTTERLVLTVNLPAVATGRVGRTLLVGLIGP